ncbi:hypothetical protein MKQ68_06855 [Chitinophaga horti]|uniref:DUF4469 domain-containing protein n=1 Tax=Chitinophaga horti TaxID=2920382 RepID=A0ABY6J9G4_9BACT|nr:hypothetical protein [Chitinophaga horti]UYQ94809.1 hypothetical protein MKQ68_06855 [Chitinophaga horti]
MIQNSFNAISTGATGMFGKQVVLYVRHGRLIIAKAPRKRPGPGTPGQERTRADFSQATGWSARVRSNEALQQLYHAATGNGKNVHNLAIADYLKAPEVHEVYIQGGTIFIRATDNFQVKDVYVTVELPDGTVLEKGLAACSGDDAWNYRPQHIPPGARVIVTASDLPGNECQYILTLPESNMPIVYVAYRRVAQRVPQRKSSFANTG